jgi:modulator of FtsH protease HflK
MPRDYPNSPHRPAFPVRVNFRLIAAAILALLLVIGILGCFYTVPTDSVAVVQRFGAYSSTRDPGLHFKLPWGIDVAEIVPIKRQIKAEFGYLTRGASNPYQGGDEPDEEKAMVTGDLNAALVEWAVQYHISNPKDFLFNFNNPSATLRAVSESVMRGVVGDRTVDEVLTVGRQEMEAQCLEQMQKMVADLGMGLQIDQVLLGNVNPPQPVQASFDEVNRAQQEKEQLINQASGEYNRLVPRTRGEAEQKVSAAEGYASKRVNEAEGDASRFIAVLNEYQKAPQVTRKRIYLETMGEILPTLPGKVILDEAVPQFLPLMQLRQPAPAPAAPAPRSRP